VTHLLRGWQTRYAGANISGKSMKILFLLACACVIAATIGAVAIGLSLFTQPEAYSAVPAGFTSPVSVSPNFG
jgi:hypothetical protein